MGPPGIDGHRPAGKEAATVDAAALGASALAQVLVRSTDGLVLLDAQQRYVYANPAACRVLGCSLEHLRGRSFVATFAASEAATVVASLPRGEGEPASFTGELRQPGPAAKDVACSVEAITSDEGLQFVAMLRDLSGPMAAERTAKALAQTTAQLVRADTTAEILESLARYAVEGTRALACGITVLDEGHTPTSTGGYGLPAATLEMIRSLRSPIGSGLRLKRECISARRAPAGA